MQLEPVTNLTNLRKQNGHGVSTEVEGAPH